MLKRQGQTAHFSFVTAHIAYANRGVNQNHLDLEGTHFYLGRPTSYLDAVVSSFISTQACGITNSGSLEEGAGK